MIYLMSNVLWYILCLMFGILCLPCCTCLCAYVWWCLCVLFMFRDLISESNASRDRALSLIVLCYLFFFFFLFLSLFSLTFEKPPHLPADKRTRHAFNNMAHALTIARSMLLQASCFRKWQFANLQMFGGHDTRLAHERPTPVSASRMD